MIEIAIIQAPVSNIKSVAHYGQGRSLTLGRWSEDRSVELDHRLHVNRPPGIDVPRVHIKRNNVMFDGGPAIGCNHGAQKQRP
jgi:hypothetical protein